MTPILNKSIPYIITLAVGLVCGWVGHTHWSAPTKTAVTYHPMVVQKDGSVVAARAPEAAPKAPMTTPKGTVVDSTTHITLKPRKPVTDDHSAIPEDCAHLMCPAVSIDLASVHGKDGPDEVVKVDGADVDTATFHSKSTFDQPVDHRHWAGVNWWRGNNYTAQYIQSSGPLGIGAQAGVIDGKKEAAIGVGWRW